MGDEPWREVLDFWLGELGDDGLATEEQRKVWWKKDPAFDEEIRQRFGGLYDAIVAGEREAWLDAPRGRLAYVIVLDQFSRNMFRDTPRMYAADERAVRATREGLERKHDESLAAHEQLFLYMPLMHAEDLASQRLCEELLAALADAHPGPVGDVLRRNVGFAEKHRVIVERFGRFPHRNALLGRASTPEEEAFLKEPGSSF